MLIVARSTLMRQRAPVHLGLIVFARPAGAVEHRQGHQQGVVLPGAVVRQAELVVDLIDQRDAAAGRLDVFEPPFTPARPLARATQPARRRAFRR